jgi:hypothetical protein
MLLCASVLWECDPSLAVTGLSAAHGYLVSVVLSGRGSLVLSILDTLFCGAVLRKDGQGVFGAVAPVGALEGCSLVNASSRVW